MFPVQNVRKLLSLAALANSERLFSAKWFAAYSMILFGSIIMAAGYVYFVIPYVIVPGGVYGIGIILHHLWGLPTGLSGLVLNIPLIFIGIKVLGPRFGVKTIVGMVLTSALIDLLAHFWGDTPLVDDPLLSAVFGGVLIGAGLGLIFKAKATTGGTDIVAQMLNRYTRIPVGQLIIIVDALIVILAIITFREINLALYALVTIYVTGRVLDGILTGMSYYKSVFIISQKHDELASVITGKLDRSGTFLMGRGMYGGEEKQVIFTAVSRRELAILESSIREIDPRAFITVMDTREIHGEGFQPISED